MPTRKEYAGGAPATTLSTGINNSTTAIPLTSGTGYPTGASYPFVICIDRGLSTEEKVLCDSRSGNNVTANASGRGYDGTAAATHATGATVEHVVDALTLTDLSGLAYGAVANTLVDAKGDLIVASAADTPARLAVGTDYGFLQALAAATNGVQWGSAYTAYTPSWTTVGAGADPTIGNGTIAGRYLRVGKMCHFQATITFGSTTTVGSGDYSIGMPFTTSASATTVLHGYAFDTSAVARVSLYSVAVAANAATVPLRVATDTAVTNAAPYTWATGDEIHLSGLIEVA